MTLQTPKGSPIAKIEVFPVPPRWLFVRVETADGYIGWGESSLEGHSEAVEGAFQDLRERFVGWDADGIEDIWQVAYRARLYRGGPVLMSALSGLDIALWDIKGKKLRAPVWQLLGGKVRDRIKVYGWLGGEFPNLFGNAMFLKQQGFMTVTIPASSSLAWIDSPSVVRELLTYVQDVHSLGMDVGINFHGRVHKGMAKQLAKVLEPQQPLFIQDPSPPNHVDETAHIASMVSTPIAIGQHLHTRNDFRPYLEKRAMDIAQPNVSHCGGISELRRIASLAEMYDVAFAPSCPIGPIAFAASMQVSISAPNFVIQETSCMTHYNDTREDLHLFYLSNPAVLEVRNGHILNLEGNGIGVEVNEVKVRETSAQYCASGKPWRSQVWRGDDGGLREW